jgi:hypothetical protein
MRYRLRTLLIVLALGPPAIWAVWTLLPPLEPELPPQVVIVDGILKKNPAGRGPVSRLTSQRQLRKHYRLIETLDKHDWK